MTRYEEILRYWRGKGISTDAELAEALNGHSISFAYHSGRIENENVTYHDTREIFEHDGVTSYTGDLRTLFEIRNARNANELLLHNHPPIIIHEEDRRAYFSALERWDEEQDLSPLVKFLEEQTEKTWERSLRRGRT